MNALTAEEVEAIVAKVVAGKKGNPYVVTYTASGKEPITFLLSAWQGKHPPEKAQVVVLTGVRKFVHGWQAHSARPVLRIG